MSYPLCTTDDQEEVARAMCTATILWPCLLRIKRDGLWVSLPSTTLLDVMEEEATEDMEKMAAIMSSDGKPYLKTACY